MQPAPRRAVTAQAQDPLDAQSTGPVLLVDDIPHGLKPQAQGQFRIGEKGACRHGEVVTASGATIEGRFHGPDLGLRTTRTVRTLRPADGFEIGTTRILILKSFVELQHGLRVLGHVDYYNRLGLGESSA